MVDVAGRAAARRPAKVTPSAWRYYVLRYALLSAALTTMLGALIFAAAAQSIRGDIRRAL